MDGIDLVDFGAAQAQDLAVQVDVLAAGEFGVEAGAQFQQGGDASARHHASGGGLQNPADDLQQGALAAAVGPDQAEHFTLFDLEADIAQRPEIRVPGLGVREQLAQAVDGTAIQAIELGNVLNKDQIRS